MEFNEILCTFTWRTNCYGNCSKRTKNEEDTRIKNNVRFDNVSIWRFNIFEHSLLAYGVPKQIVKLKLANSYFFRSLKTNKI